MGFDPAKLSGFVSSGEEAFCHIKEHHSGQRCLFFTWERELNEPGASFLEGLDVSSASAASADFILCQGTEVISNGAAVVKTAVKTAVQLPAVHLPALQLPAVRLAAVRAA